MRITTPSGALGDTDTTSMSASGSSGDATWTAARLSEVNREIVQPALLTLIASGAPAQHGAALGQALGQKLAPWVALAALGVVVIAGVQVVRLVRKK